MATKEPIIINPVPVIFGEENSIPTSFCASMIDSRTDSNQAIILEDIQVTKKEEE